MATTDGSFSAVLGVGTGEVMLQSRKIEWSRWTLEGTRCLRLRSASIQAYRGGRCGRLDALATLVRLPKFTGVDCPAEPDVACSLSGVDLFLVDSVSVDADFAHVTRVPDGFTEPVLRIPHPLQGRLYVKTAGRPCHRQRRGAQCENGASRLGGRAAISRAGTPARADTSARDHRSPKLPAHER